jgi:isoamylase
MTAHDDFTLNDLVSNNDKHNEANCEDNRDGSTDNRSWNCGVEGPTDDEHVQALRGRQMRNFLATLLLSQGTPMLLAGDEFGRTQNGNNNAYCQDNEISWVDWDLKSPADMTIGIHRHRSLPGHFSCLLIVETTVKPPSGAWNVKWHRRASGSAEPGHLSARYHRPCAWDRS